MKRLLASAVLLGLALGGPAAALTIVNEDDDSHAVTLVQGDVSSEIEIAAGAEMVVPCADGCTLVLASGDQADFGDEDEVIISEGRFTITE